MNVLQSLDELAEWRRSLAAPVGVAIGAFDGVHIGHQYLLRTLRDWADEAGGRAVAMTFEPHPLAVLAPSQAPRLLTSLEDKLALFAGLGLDTASVIEFTREFAALTPEEFMRLVIRDVLGASYVIVGFNFTFGAFGRGRPEDLVRAGPELGFETVVAPPVCVGDAYVSSTSIRAAVARGAVEEAAVMLGRPYRLPVAALKTAAGAGDGSHLCNGTADARFAIPRTGVYAGQLKIDGQASEVAVLVDHAGEGGTVKIVSTRRGTPEPGVALWARLSLAPEEVVAHPEAALAAAREKIASLALEDEPAVQVPGKTAL